MVDFRKRFGEEGMQRMAEAIALASLKNAEPKADSESDDGSDPPTNEGQGTSNNNFSRQLRLIFLRF